MIIMLTVCLLLKKPLTQGHQNHNKNHQEEFFLALLQLLLRQKQIKRKLLVCLLTVGKRTRLSLEMSQVAQQATPPGWDASPSQGYPPELNLRAPVFINFI